MHFKMVPTGATVAPVGGLVMLPAPRGSARSNWFSTGFSPTPSTVIFTRTRSFGGVSLGMRACPSRGSGVHLLVTSTPLLRADNDSFPSMIPAFHKVHKMGDRSLMVPRASKDVPYRIRYPKMTEKPKWWWRTLACLPYILPIHEIWMYAENVFHIDPLLENLNFLVDPFLLMRLPSWFLMAYCYIAYLGVVRSKDWPHFLRFHVTMGMLFDNAIQIIGTASGWLPLVALCSKIGLVFWTAVFLAFLLAVLECIRSALGGKYPSIPFLRDAAYIQTSYE